MSDPTGVEERAGMTTSELRRCKACDRYTLESTCPLCHGPTGTPHPARWSPEDRYARYRRALLRSAAQERAATAPDAPAPARP